MQQDSTERPVRVGLISLGCAKNLVDAEIMLGSLLKDGVEITNDAALADVMIVNTCSFIDSAQEESVDAILESAAVREAANRGQGLVVSGCLPQRFRDELPKLFPEVDAFMGIDQVPHVGAIVKQALARRRERLAASPKSSRRNPKNEMAVLKPRRSRGDEAQTSLESEPPHVGCYSPETGSEVVARLAQLEQSRPDIAGENDWGLRATGKSGVAPAITSSFTHHAPRITGKTAVQGPQGALLEVTPRPRYIPDYATPRFRLTPRHFAYVKIAEGCNHPCSFCIIPRMRGGHRSRAQADLVAEARALLADGVKELNLISQDTTYYGLDLRPRASRAIASPERFAAAAQALPTDSTTLCSLLRELNALPGQFWIRLLYTHPAHWTDELIQTIAGCPKVARYVDMPLQHIHANMLQRMRRETSPQYIADLIGRIRAGVQDIALRTTFIVGFPGETEASFETLLEFIRETKFERLGVFVYSREEGTIAGKMSNQISDAVKQRRRELAMAEQHKVARAISTAFTGRTIRVLVEHAANAKELKAANVRSWEHGLIRERDTSAARLKGQYWVARGEADAPDIDGRVYVRGKLTPGGFAQVRVIGHTDYDLIAQPA